MIAFPAPYGDWKSNTTAADSPSLPSSNCVEIEFNSRYAPGQRRVTRWQPHNVKDALSTLKSTADPTTVGLKAAMF